jgi:hypothetical protein
MIFRKIKNIFLIEEIELITEFANNVMLRMKYQALNGSGNIQIKQELKLLL